MSLRPEYRLSKTARTVRMDLGAIRVVTELLRSRLDCEDFVDQEEWALHRALEALRKPGALRLGGRKAPRERRRP
jgi:hypothetical protein